MGITLFPLVSVGRIVKHGKCVRLHKRGTSIFLIIAGKDLGTILVDDPIERFALWRIGIVKDRSGSEMTLRISTIWDQRLSDVMPQDVTGAEVGLYDGSPLLLGISLGVEENG